MSRVRRPKLSHNDIKKFFEEHNCVLLSKTYKNSKQLLKYKCNICGRINVGCYNNLYKVRHPQSKNKYFCIPCWKKKTGAGKEFKRIVLRQKLYCMSEAAKILGVSPSQFYYHIRYKKTLPAPTRFCTITKLNRFYSMQDIEKIKKMLK